ncbi:glycerophosphodiester phosphodiesterase [Oceanobacillus sp. 1P07AA]|uniref:glycerophosphodiester phosphodiesterase n=1 Tax=Oceanobacillus sp. 1P07AA TaxID=3132293 RepID=UPI0039A6C011
MQIRGIAHRGYPVKYPENTLSSFQAAIDLGFTHMELDVHLSKDGIPVVMHDDKIDRMTNGVGEIRDYTLQELKKFNVQEGEQIPTLQEALELAKDRIIVSIELKKTQLYKGIEEKVFQVVEELDMVDQVYIISFHYAALKKLRKLSNELELGPVVNRVKRSHFRQLKRINAEYFAVRFDGIKDKHIEWCQNNDVQLVAWKVNEQDEMHFIKQNPSILATTDELEKYKAVIL